MTSLLRRYKLSLIDDSLILNKNEITTIKFLLKNFYNCKCNENIVNRYYNIKDTEVFRYNTQKKELFLCWDTWRSLMNLYNIQSGYCTDNKIIEMFINEWFTYLYRIDIITVNYSLKN